MSAKNVTAPKGSAKKIEMGNIRTLAMILALLVIWIIFSVMSKGTFISVRNISNLFRQMSTVGILGAGMVLVIITGNIDLSAGALLGLLSGFGAIFMKTLGWGTVETILVVIVIGIALSGILGSIVAFTDVPAFIATLGGTLIFEGALLGIGGGSTISPLNEDFVLLGQAYLPTILGWIITAITIATSVISVLYTRKSSKKYGFNVESTRTSALKIAGVVVMACVFTLIMNLYKGIPVPVIIMLAVVCILSLIAQNTTFGRSIYAIGGNIEASRLSGINVQKVVLFVYMINGFICAIGGIIYSARLNAGIPAAGSGMELDAIAAAIIGGTSMSGGSGKVAGALLGALFMASLDNGMSILDIQAFWQSIVKGLILVIAVWFDVYSKKKG